MTLSKLTFALTAFAFAVSASAASLVLNQSAWVGQTELKPGSYKIEIQGDKAIFKKGKETVEVPVSVDKNGKQKYNDTMVESSGSKIQQIHIGGTTTTITIKPSASAPAAAGTGAGVGQ